MLLLRHNELPRETALDNRLLDTVLNASKSSGWEDEEGGLLQTQDQS